MSAEEIIRDLLVEFDEMSFFPGTTVPDHDAYARDYRERLASAVEELLLEREQLIAKDQLNQADMDDLNKRLEQRVSAVCPEFMQDYKLMRDELNACYDENGKLTAENERLKREMDEAVKEKAKAVLQKVKSYALDKEVGLKYLIGKLAKENGVEVE